MEGITQRARTFSIEDVLRLLESGEWTLQPKFQRRRTEWPLLAKSYLLDSILRGLPIPTIYVRERRDPQLKRTTREIVDGQQRLSIIKSFITGKFSLSPKTQSEFAGMAFQDLDYEVQEGLKSYELSIGLITGADDKSILLIFSRLNSFSLPLNDQEKLNAEFSGVFKQTIYQLAFDLTDFWREHHVFTDKQVSRMAEVDFVSHLFAVVLKGHHTPYLTVRKLYETYDDDCPFAETLSGQVGALLEHIHACIRHQQTASLFFKPAMLHSLTIALYDKYIGPISSTPGAKGATKSLPSPDDLRRRLDGFAAKYASDSALPRLKEALRGRTKSALSRRVRHEHLSPVV